MILNDDSSVRLASTTSWHVPWRVWISHEKMLAWETCRTSIFSCISFHFIRFHLIRFEYLIDCKTGGCTEASNNEGILPSPLLCWFWETCADQAQEKQLLLHWRLSEGCVGRHSHIILCNQPTNPSSSLLKTEEEEKFWVKSFLELTQQQHH